MKATEDDVSDFDEYATPEASDPPPLPPLPESGGQATSGLAVGSFVLALIGICGGVTAVIALPLGIIAMIAIKGKPNVKGFGLALTGVIVSAVLIPAWIGVGYMIYRATLSLQELQPKIEQMTNDLADALERNDLDAAVNLFTESSRDEVRTELAGLAAARGPFTEIVKPSAERWLQFEQVEEKMACVIPLTVTWSDGSTGVVRVLFDLSFESFQFDLINELPFRGIDVSFDAAAGAGSGPESGD
jgi:hypothetical protein